MTEQTHAGADTEPSEPEVRPSEPEVRPSEPEVRPSEPEVRLSVPAHGAFLSLIRTTTAAVAARLDLTIDEIEDLRIAVDEAAAILLGDLTSTNAPTQAPDDRTVEVTFGLDPDNLVITLSAGTGADAAPDQTGFGWTVLSALVGSVIADHRDGRTTIVLSHRRRALT